MFSELDFHQFISVLNIFLSILILTMRTVYLLLQIIGYILIFLNWILAHLIVKDRVFIQIIAFGIYIWVELIYWILYGSCLSWILLNIIVYIKRCCVTVMRLLRGSVVWGVFNDILSFDSEYLHLFLYFYFK